MLMAVMTAFLALLRLISRACCGEAASESERTATGYLLSRLSHTGKKLSTQLINCVLIMFFQNRDSYFSFCQVV